MTDETIEPSLAESREKLRKQVAVAIHMAAMSAGGSVGEKMPPAYAAADAAIEVIERSIAAAPPSPRSGRGLTPSKHGSSAAMRAQVIEECAKVADNYARDGRIYKEYACESADEIAARIRSLSAVSAIARDVGKPVAWRYKYRDCLGWVYVGSNMPPDEDDENIRDVQPLYLHPTTSPS